MNDEAKRYHLYHRGRFAGGAASYDEAHREILAFERGMPRRFIPIREAIRLNWEVRDTWDKDE